MRLWRANMSVTEEKTFWVENNGFEIANPWELDTLGNYPWDTLGMPLGYPWGNHIGNLINLSIIIDT